MTTLNHDTNYLDRKEGPLKGSSYISDFSHALQHCSVMLMQQNTSMDMQIVPYGLHSYSGVWSRGGQTLEQEGCIIIRAGKIISSAFVLGVEGVCLLCPGWENNLYFKFRHNRDTIYMNE